MLSTYVLCYGYAFFPRLPVSDPRATVIWISVSRRSCICSTQRNWIGRSARFVYWMHSYVDHTRDASARLSLSFDAVVLLVLCAQFLRASNKPNYLSRFPRLRPQLLTLARGFQIPGVDLHGMCGPLSSIDERFYFSVPARRTGRGGSSPNSSPVISAATPSADAMTGSFVLSYISFLIY